MRLLILICVFVLSSCTVNQWEINRSIEYCKDNGGIDWYAASRYVVMCNNGDVFDIRIPKEEK